MRGNADIEITQRYVRKRDEMNRLPAALLLLTANGCSLGINQIDPKWDGTEPPVCDSEYGATVLDAIVGGVALGVSSAALAEEEATVGLATGIGGLVFAVASIAGANAIKECKEAKAQWRIGGAIGRASRANGARRESSDEEIEQAAEEKAVRKKAAALEVKRQEVALAAASKPRGFFCAVASSTGFCTRQKADCVRSRDTALVAIADLGLCALTEKAWCFDAGSGDDDERCAPTKEWCEAVQVRAAASGSVGACVEVE